VNFKSRHYKSWGGSASKFADAKTGSWRTIRPVVNSEKCCRCGWCYIYCPSGCIAEQDDRFEPNFDYCKGCGLCAAECPVDAIEMVSERRRQT
jgi:pyruvate ferredoxin oxidoreductase delta subunit